MNYELISLTELNPKNNKACICAECMFSLVIMSANKGQGRRMAPTAQQISHS